MSKQQLTEVVPVRFSTTQVAQIDRNAGLAEIPRSRFIRRAAAGLPLWVPGFSRVRYRLLLGLSRVGNNLDQLRRVAEASEDPELAHLLEAAGCDLLNAKHALMDLGGRRRLRPR